MSVLEQLNNGSLHPAQAQTLLSISRATLYRWLRSFRAKDFDFLTHKNKGREPHNKFSVEFKSRVIQNIKKRYRDFQPALAQKYLQRDGLCLSRSSIWRINREIKSSEKVSHTPLPVHSLRRRRHRFGELIQIDGSPHRWFGDDGPEVCLLAFIDDATGKITSARFFETETLQGYLTLLIEHIARYGIPVALYSDRHLIFSRDVPKNITEEPPQYARVCQRLGIEPILAQTPQAKGRVERLFKTLQGRWPKQFRLEKISCIEQANAIIANYVEEFNEEFSVMPFEELDAHAHIDDLQEIKRICAIWQYRKLNANLNCRFGKRIFQVLTDGQPAYGLKFKTVAIIQYPDGQEEMALIGDLNPRLLKFQCFDVKTRRLELTEASSKTVDNTIEKIIKRRKIIDTPWRQQLHETAVKGIKAREERRRRLAQSREFLARIHDKANRD